MFISVWFPVEAPIELRDNRLFEKCAVVHKHTGSFQHCLTNNLIQSFFFDKYKQLLLINMLCSISTVYCSFVCYTALLTTAACSNYVLYCANTQEQFYLKAYDSKQLTEDSLHYHG